MFPFPWIQSAVHNIEPFIDKTPLTYDQDLNLYIKWENQQITGSFKARGAFNKTISLQAWERERGLVAASAGNHGQGLALAGKQYGIPVTIFASETASRIKLQAIKDLGAKLITVPGGYSDAEIAGLIYAKEFNATWVSPYNDPQVIAGQATLGLEILEQAPDLKSGTWLVPVGGGGLLSGIGIALKENPSLENPVASQLVGIQSEASPFMHALFHTNTQSGVIEYPSLADGLSGAVEDGSITIHLVRNLVDDLILVSEDEIVEAIQYAWQKFQQKIEASAAVTLAAIITGKISQRPIVAIVTGGNIDPEIHARLVA